MNKNNSIEFAVKDVIKMFRYIFENDKKLLSIIDESYEEVLLGELKYIPHDVEDYVMTYINLVKTAYSCFDICKFNNILHKFGTNVFPEFTINSYNIFLQGLNKLSLSAKDKSRINNLVGKFRPLFICLDHIVNRSRYTVDRLADMASSKSFDDML